MMNQPLGGSARRDRLPEGAHHKVGRHPPAETTPDDLAREEVFDRRHKEPALCGRDVSDGLWPEMRFPQHRPSNTQSALFPPAHNRHGHRFTTRAMSKS